MPGYLKLSLLFKSSGDTSNSSQQEFQNLLQAYGADSDRSSTELSYQNPSLQSQNAVDCSYSQSVASNSSYPHACNYCGKRWKTQRSLYYHLRTHEAPHVVCPLCPYKTRQRSKLKRHVASIHQLAICMSCYAVLPKDSLTLHVCGSAAV